VSGQFHALAALPPRERAPGTPWKGGCAGHVSCMNRRTMHIEFSWDNFEHLGVDGRMILNWILKKEDATMRTGVI